MDILELAKSINKELGVKEGGLMTSNTPSMDIERISTGSLSYDIITGGGFPKGRMIGIEGMESSGKSTTTLLALASYMKQDKRPAAIIDSEHAFDRKYAANLGVDLDRLMIVQPDNLEDAALFAQRLVESGDVGMLVFDSIKAAQPQKVIEEGVNQHNIGLQAKEVGNMLGSANPKLKKNDVIMLVVNQQRENPGGYGSGKVSPAANSLKFYASIRMEIFRGSKAENQSYGKHNLGWAKTVKNKTYPPYQETDKYMMLYGTGICVSTEVLDYGTDIGVLYKQGNSYYYDETFENDPKDLKKHVNLGGSKHKCKLFLDDNLELRQHLYDTILFNWFNEEK